MTNLFVTAASFPWDTVQGLVTNSCKVPLVIRISQTSPPTCSKTRHQIVYKMSIIAEEKSSGFHIVKEKKMVRGDSCCGADCRKICSVWKLHVTPQIDQCVANCSSIHMRKHTIYSGTSGWLTCGSILPIWQERDVLHQLLPTWCLQICDNSLTVTAQESVLAHMQQAHQVSSQENFPHIHRPEASAM